MRHVDEGTIHAWLDGEIADAAEVAWIEDHLRECAECSARLAEERATFEQADALLAGIAPASERPRLDELIAKSEARRAEANETPSVSAPRPARGQRWVIPVGWAASVTLAVGIGWLVRDATETRDAAPAAMMAERATAPATGDVPVQPVAPQSSAPFEPSVSGREAAQRPQPVDPLRSPASQDSRARAADATSRAPRAPTPAEANEFAAADTATASRAEAAPDAAPAAAPAPRAITPSAPAVAAAPPAASAPAAPVVAGAPPPAPGAPAVSAPASAPAADAQTLARAATIAPEQVQVQERRAGLPQTAGGAVGNLASGAATPNAAARLASTVGEWRTMPRTEAAVRSGMPLYGVTGLEPVATAVSSDNRAVRTTYRLESGALVELEQERTQPAAQSLSLRSGERAVTTRPGTSAVSETLVGSRTWSETRGTIRVLLRTVSDTDLAALGSRLRVE